MKREFVYPRVSLACDFVSVRWRKSWYRLAENLETVVANRWESLANSPDLRDTSFSKKHGINISSCRVKTSYSSYERSFLETADGEETKRKKKRKRRRKQKVRARKKSATDARCRPKDPPIILDKLLSPRVREFQKIIPRISKSARASLATKISRQSVEMLHRAIRSFSKLTNERQREEEKDRINHSYRRRFEAFGHRSVTTNEDKAFASTVPLKPPLISNARTPYVLVV